MCVTTYVREMAFVEFEELEVNFAHGCHFPESDTTLYPFGYLDDQLWNFTAPTLVESRIIPKYLAISTNSLLGRHLRQIANHYNCSDIEKGNKIFLPNPNNKYCYQQVSLASSLLIHFVGVLCASDNSRQLLITLI